MRIYEFSKKLGISNKEIVDLLKEQGFEVISHMSALSPAAINFLDTYYHQHSPESIQAMPPQKENTEEKSASQAPIEVSVKKEFSKNQERGALVATPKSVGLVIEPMTISQLAQKVMIPVNEIMLTLLKRGTISSKNQLLPARVVEQIAQHYQIPIEASVVKKESFAKPIAQQVSSSRLLQKRMPIIVVIGHVDHGKTTLLDFIRKTKVAAREQGGITQHLGAYQVKTDQGGMVFLDTPGHAAFIKMRARGVKVADIAILVVAADDGVMPQTVEALKHAKNAQIPIIVAINKIDKASPAQIESVKRSLTQYDLLPEEWGGQTICMPISAKTGAGVDQLLEMIQLQAEVMELKSDPTKAAQGFVLEARVEKGRGSIATVIAHDGTIHLGDYFIAEQTFGKVTALIDSYEKNLKEAGPAIPVQVSGFDQLPNAGDFFEVVTQERYQKAKSKGVIREEPKQFVSEGVINLILKADTKSSKEAITESIEQINQKNAKKFQIIYSEVGNISESDVELAHTTHSRIIGFHIKHELNALSLAQKYNVSIETYQVIYKLLESLESLIKEKEVAPLVATKIGEAVIRKVFQIKNVGTIAGAYVKEGRLSRNGTVQIWRGKNKIGSGPIKSLERDRKPVKEVHAGFECAFLVEDFNEWEVDDRVECMLNMPAKSTGK